MEALSSSFRHPQFLQVRSLNNIGANVKRRHQPVIRANIFKKPLDSTILNKLDDFICTFLDPSPLRPSIDPEHSMSGYFAPAEELPPTACTEVAVEGGGGPLPSCLDGAYIRNGPNPQFVVAEGRRRPYHLFDGDGMLHMIRISGGKATTFCSRFVKTHKHTVERENGSPFVPSTFSSFNGIATSLSRCMLTAARVLTGQFDPLNKGLGAANTSVSLLPGGGGGANLFALSECDLPYEIKVTEEGDIVTLGRHDFRSSISISSNNNNNNNNKKNNNPLLFLNMTAHPKVDEKTGETFAYRCNITRPFLTMFRIDPDGRKQKDVHVHSLKESTIIHDFSVTENFCVFVDTQIVMNPLSVLRGRPPVGVDRAKVPRLGVIGKYAEDDSRMWWTEAPGLNMFHSVNAWEEDGGATIVMVVTNALQVEELFESIGLAQLRLEKITIDVKAQTLQRQPLSTKLLEFGVINLAYAAKKNRYVYAAMIGQKGIDGIVKLDLSLTHKDGHVDCVVASHLYRPGCCGGEPFFVPKEPNNPSADEDDGYLVTFVTDENNGESKFVVMDAKSVTLDIIAAVKLPCRIPSGFHGLFITEAELNKV
ncbi:hypothetical protein ABFS82_05G118200 [Erythranthe guttata]|nr:PREDICTED: probable carotenoid cleavage dioxygenase 4, chloroplastic [Erythranthe guttata]|eukprot:XP_012847005.1 PREDICTED: probable carotenoid cleavage dioxygenase 4, chloroplastic [Erythranthe guttata]